MRDWKIFRCAKDDSWIVSVCDSIRNDPDVMRGVADCPDERTARAVLEAMQARDRSGNSQPIATMDENKSRPLDSLPLSARARHILHYSFKVETLEDITSITRTDLKIARNCGEATVNEVVTLLHKYGLSLKSP